MADWTDACTDCTDKTETTLWQFKQFQLLAISRVWKSNIIFAGRWGSVVVRRYGSILGCELLHVTSTFKNISKSFQSVSKLTATVYKRDNCVNFNGL